MYLACMLWFELFFKKTNANVITKIYSSCISLILWFRMRKVCVYYTLKLCMHSVQESKYSKWAVGSIYSLKTHACPGEKENFYRTLITDLAL